MNNYLKWNQKTITDFSDSNLNSLYHQGYLLTRLGKGVMTQTRSVRIDLSQFELTSENRRIFRKVDRLQVTCYKLSDFPYHWSIGKMAKDFYETKFGKGTFSANKIKELVTDEGKSNFNVVLVYSWHETRIAYCIAFQTPELLHYAYPFYKLTINHQPSTITNIGLGMMLKAIIWAKTEGRKYVYLGSAQRPSDTYKLQFAGLEWFGGESWNDNLKELKKILASE